MAIWENIRKYKRLWWLLFLFITLTLVMSAIIRKRKVGVSDLKVEVKPLKDGNFLIKENEIFALIEKSFSQDLRGTQVEDIDLQRVEQVAESDPSVDNADVFIDANGILRVAITEREPVLRIKDHEGNDYYLDRQGKKIPWSKYYSPRVVIVTGNVPQFMPDFLQKKKHLLKEILFLHERLSNDDFLYAFIEQIHVNNQNEIILIPKVGRQKIVLGNLEHLDDKIFRLKAFYKQGFSVTGWQKYDVIDLQYRGQVVCRT